MSKARLLCSCLSRKTCRCLKRNFEAIERLEVEEKLAMAEKDNVSIYIK